MILEKLETYFSAATYAQCGEFETALGIMNKKTSNRQDIKGGLKMSQGTVKKTSSAFIIPAVGFGALSLTLYALLLTNEGRIMDIFTKGGLYAALPVGTAFLFSFVHGAFASNLLSALGIEAKK